jgi:hypothetical protein
MYVDSRLVLKLYSQNHVKHWLCRICSVLTHNYSTEEEICPL